MSDSIVLCGVGGQGTILASKLLAAAAMSKGLPVKTAETIGMAQRGGSVFSHVRIGDGAVSPLIGRGRADLIIAFEPAEAVRQLPYLREGGTVVVSTRPIIPVSATIGGPAYDLAAVMAYLRERVGEKLVVVDADAAAEALGSAKCLNVVLLGAAVRTGVLALTADDVRSAIAARLPERFHELNFRALDYAI
ncbi:MAG: indolepyruvate oxidoreductase subunit beta [Coriobacteriaceae bacterium]|nr:indolepyruvate oxidoreductase subunit beta [Coriobacteriaceae bacterium]